MLAACHNEMAEAGNRSAAVSGNPEYLPVGGLIVVDNPQISPGPTVQVKSDDPSRSRTVSARRICAEPSTEPPLQTNHAIHNRHA
jgi:hypothetical protein